MALSKTDVLVEAMSILDAYGLPDLSMRRLADQLGVRPSALYWHFENKQSLLAAIATTIVTELTPVENTPWPQSIKTWADQLRALLLRYRDSADLISSMRSMGLAATDLPYAAAEALIRSGFDRERAHAVAQTLVIFTLGHVIEEQAHRQWVDLGVADGGIDVDSDSFSTGIGLILSGAEN